MKHEIKSFGTKIELKDIDMSKNIVTGYAAVYGNVDAGGDILMKGALDKTIQENIGRIPYLAQHKMHEEPIGKIVSLESDDYGLKFTAKIAMTTKGKDYMQLIKEGIIGENSIGYKTIQSTPNSHGGRDLKEIQLWEISAVNVAMNPKALIMDAKGAVDNELFKDYLNRFDAMANIIKKGNLSDEMCYQLEAQLYQLKSIIEQVVTQPTEEVTEPTAQESNEVKAQSLDDLSADILKMLDK